MGMVKNLFIFKKIFLHINRAVLKSQGETYKTTIYALSYTVLSVILKKLFINLKV